MVTQHKPMPVTVRPFEADDFERVVALMPPEWCFANCTPDETIAQARMDFSGVLSCCNVRLVAESAAPISMDNAGDAPLAGILFARLAALPSPTDAAFWNDIWEQAREELLGGTPHGRLAARYEEQLGERGDLLIQSAGPAMGEDNELELFVANPTTRGCGAGGALMAAFEEILSHHNVGSYWLQTDTTCTWEWYERHGYVRAADVELSEDYPMPPHGYVFDSALPTPRVFMYRKDRTNAGSPQ